MSAVAERDHLNSKVSPPGHDGGAPQPSEEQLLDVLYEVLATGPVAKSKLTREQVERFLHEHARQAKPISEMVAFFQEHDLPLVAPDEYGADAELRELASGLQRERSSMIPGLLFAEPEAPVLPQATVEAQQREATGQHLLAQEDAVSTGRHAAVVVAAPVKPVHWAVWAAAAVVLLALASGLAFSYLRASELEMRLELARSEQKSVDAALTKLERRAETLQGELATSEADRQAQELRFADQLAEQAKQRATEEAAVEKVLGVRYTKLRQKLASKP